ncbi:permease [Pacificimonas flava]|uniref:Probable membrane transporter protein n=2 Tax=Pacificimonas TaxID=1960290 RepID=A0A219B4B5_9SPHN|nr:MULTISPECIES: sulfite exporter TauE/SafE family protein [Pacificimonas]MBZ6377167.1 sulfite exporter TauE/SafE family protein [Pacificimonas aurantium]OWV33111.1 permease [Pacificimonas flava]
MLDGSLLEFLPLLAIMLGAGLFAGFVAGLFGIGGGFVVVPALVALLPIMGGDPNEYFHVAVGTSLATIVITSLRSVQAHARHHSVDFAVLKAWAPWVIAGDVVGVALATQVDGAGLAVIFGGGVLIMALHFLWPVLKTKTLRDDLPGGAGRIAIGALLGAFSSLLGIGGGTPAVIVMTLCGRSIHSAIGTASGVGFLIALPSAIGFAIIGLGKEDLPIGSLGYVNLLAAISIVSMSVFSAPWGAAAAHRLPADKLKRVFGVYLIFIGGLMIGKGVTG